MFRCITAGNCILNAKTRKYCRKCRLDKCFSIGMKKDWILTEEEKLLKRRKHRNRDSLERKDADSSSSPMIQTMNYSYSNESDHSEPSSNTNHHIGQSSCQSSLSSSSNNNHNHNHVVQSSQSSAVPVSSMLSNSSSIISTNSSTNHSTSSPVCSSSPSLAPSSVHHLTSTSSTSSVGNNSNIIIVPVALDSVLHGFNNKSDTSITKEKIINYLKSKLSLNFDNATINFDAIENTIRDISDSSILSTSQSQYSSSFMQPSSQYNQNNQNSQIPTFETFKSTSNHTNGFGDNSGLGHVPYDVVNGHQDSFDYFVQQDSIETFYPNGGGSVFDSHSMNYSHSNQTVIHELQSSQTVSSHIQPSQPQLSSTCSSSSSIDVIKTENDCSLNQSGTSSSSSSLPQATSTSPQSSSSPPSSGYLWKISDNVYKHALQLEYTDNPLLIKRHDSGEECLTGLSTLEKNRLDDIHQYLTPLFLHVHQANATEEVISEFVSGMEYFETLVRKIIIAVKNIHSFKCMCQDDQIVLIKGSVGEIKTLLHVRFFNPIDDRTVAPHPSEENTIIILRHDYLKKTYGEEIFSRCKTFFLSFRDDWKYDDSIINLMIMIMLFFPNRTNLKHREYIR